MADLDDVRPRVAPTKQQSGGFVGTLLWCALGLAALLFIFGPVFGLRETGSRIRSRKIHEELERRNRESREASERERLRTEEHLERARKEIFGE